MKGKLIIALSLSVMSLSAKADTLLQTLATCDSTFFSALKSYPSLASIADKVRNNNFHENDNLIMDVDYTTPEGIHLKQFYVTYTNFNQYKKYSEMDVRGEFYYWGFKTSDSISDVISKAPVMFEKNTETLYMYRPMIKQGDGAWRVNESAVSGISPGEGTSERVFLAEQESGGLTTLSCSIQGDISKADIRDAGLTK